MEKLTDSILRGFTASYKEGGDIYLFEVAAGGTGGEYAAVFRKSDGSHYTAAIVPAGKKERFSVRSDNLLNCLYLEMVDIQTDEVFYKAQFSPLEEEQEPLDDEISLRLDLPEEEQPSRDFSVKALGALSEKEEGLEYDISQEALPEQLSEVFPEALPEVLPEKPPEQQPKTLSRFEINEKIFEENLTPCLFGENLPGEHKFYVFDARAGQLDIKIDLTDSSVNAKSVYAGHRSSITSGDNPPKIIGLITHRTSRYYVFGIFGLPEKEFQPFGGVTGFVYYAKLHEADLGGYWLMYINADTGRICLPKL